jgi:hypothetical protein
MRMNRLAKDLTVAAGLILLLMVPGSARGDSPQQHPAGPNPMPAAPGPQKLPSAEDDFAGLDLSDQQKSEISKIRHDTEARKDSVAKSQTLNSDQKDAMVLGYTRLEYSQIFRMLTPIQQKVVRQRIMAHRAAEMGNKKPQAPGN